MPKNISEFIANRKKAIDELTFKISPEGINRLIQETNAEISKHNDFIQNAASLKFGGLSEWVEVDCGDSPYYAYKAELSVLHKHSDILAYKCDVSISCYKEAEGDRKKSTYYSFFFARNVFGNWDIEKMNYFTKKQATREKVLAYAEKQLKEFFI